MKSILFIALIGLLSFSTQAQNASVLPTVAGDTIANNGTVTKTLPKITGGYQGAFVQINLSKISGTGAGTVQLQVSLDNTNWVNSGSAFTITNVASQAATFSVAAPVPVYVRLLCTGSGSESVATQTYYLYRKTAVTN